MRAPSPDQDSALGKTASTDQSEVTRTSVDVPRLPTRDNTAEQEPPPQSCFTTGDVFEDYIPRKKHSKWTALSKTGLLILGIGTTAITLALAALGFLWQGSIRAGLGEDPGTLWNNIGLLGDNKATRMVTVCSAIIRLSASMQCSIATSMLASILLERVGVSVYNAPVVSILRSIGPSPYHLLRPAIRDANRFWNQVIVGVTLLLLIIGAITQFSSTILISDFTNTLVLGLAKSSSLPFAYPAKTNSTDIQSNNWNFDPALSSWAQIPYKFPRFAEYSLGNSSLPDDGIQDTGSIYRAFPPLTNAESRTRLRRYEGPAAVVNSRIVCVRPELEVKDLLIVGYANDDATGHATYEEVSLAGIVSLSTYRQYPMLRVFGERSYSFRCRVPIGDKSKTDFWPLSICGVGLKIKSVSEGPEWIRPRDATNRSFAHLRDDTFMKSVILVLNTTGIVEDWQSTFNSSWAVWNHTNHSWSISNNTYKPDDHPWHTTPNGGPWILSQTSNDTVGFSASLCIPELDTGFYNVTMRSDVDGEELPPPASTPPSAAEIAAFRHRFLTDGNASLDNRGVMSLYPRTGNWTTSYLDSNNGWTNIKGWILAPFSDIMASFYSPVPDYAAPFDGSHADPSVLLHSTSSSNPKSANGFYSAITTSMLRETGDLSKAMQIVLMILQQSDYYSWPVGRLVPGPATYVLSTSALIPASWQGFIIVAAVMSLHFVLILLITLFFFMYSKLTILGNFWQVIAQVVSDTTMPAIVCATDMEDKEVRGLEGMRSIYEVRSAHTGKKSLTLASVHSGSLSAGWKEKQI